MFTSYIKCVVLLTSQKASHCYQILLLTRMYETQLNEINKTVVHIFKILTCSWISVILSDMSGSQTYCCCVSRGVI